MQCSLLQGSAFRCLKTGDPIDAVLDRAARESGVPITDILENLPAELAVWVDPGEVSYRIGEKGAVKVCFYFFTVFICRKSDLLTSKNSATDSLF